MTDHTETPTTPTRAERREAIWDAFDAAAEPARALLELALVPARIVRDAALKALEEEE